MRNMTYMAVTLRILRGTLKDSRGNSAGDEVVIRSRRFAIGRAVDCHLCCSSSLIDSHHCLITLDSDRIVLRDFNSTHGTYVNGTRVQGTACLFHGDHLRVGRLEFEFFVKQSRRTIEPIASWGTPRLSPMPRIVPMRDTVPESVARRLEAESSKLHPIRRPTTRSRESVFPRRS